MKKIIGVISMFALLTACNANQRTAKIKLSEEPQTYIKDRQLSGPLEQSVDPQGAAGPGLGSSYASRSYRQASIKNSQTNSLQGVDSSRNTRDIYGNLQLPQKMFPPKKETDINYLNRWDRNLINKYNLNENNPDTTSLHSCYWRPPLRENYCSIQ